MKTGLCILGCGNFAKTFAMSIQPLLPKVNLYFASRDLAKARAYCTDFNGIGAFGSYSEAVSNPNVEAVYICTPHYLHLEHALLATSAGKHVLIEKPISDTIQGGEAIISSGRDHGVTLMVAENYRFMPVVRLCQKLINDGGIGNIRLIQIQQESPYIPSNWRSDYHKNGGGVFIDAGIHKVHFLRYLLGNPNYIYATTLGQKELNLNQEDGLLLITKWKTGEVGLIYHSWTPSKNPLPNRVSISGNEGSIYFEIRKSELILDNAQGYQKFEISEPINGILPMVEEFLNSIQQGRPPEVSGEEGLQDLLIVKKAYESDQTIQLLNLDSPNLDKHLAL